MHPANACRIEDRFAAERTAPSVSRVGYGRGGAIQLRERYTELLIVRVRAVPQIAQRNRLAQLDRRIGIAPPVDPRVDPVTKADVVCQLMQFPIDCHLPCIAVRIIMQGHSVTRWHLRVWNHKITVKKELYDGDAGARHSTVPRGIGRVGWRTLRKGQGEKETFVIREAALQGL